MIHDPVGEYADAAYMAGRNEMRRECEQRHAALVAALEALVVGLDEVISHHQDTVTDLHARGMVTTTQEALIAAKQSVRDELAALLRQHTGGLTPLAPEET